MVKRPTTVLLAQVLLTLTALAHLASPFFVIYNMADTLAYYGISTTDGKGPLVTAFILRVPFLLLILCFSGIALWGMIKGNRVGRIVTCGIFVWVGGSLFLDVLWPDDDLRFSSYLPGFPQWLDILLKLAVGSVYAFFTYRLGFGPRELVYLDRYRAYGYTKPPSPPTFDE